MSKHVFLKPGDWFFGKGDGKVTTILGSCVSIVLWHPQQHLLGVSHIVLPGRLPESSATQPQADLAPLSDGCVSGRGLEKHRDLCGRYADELMIIFTLEMALFNATAAAFSASIIGGGKMFAGSTVPQVGEKNVARCEALLAAQCISVTAKAVSGSVYRRLTVDIATGQFQVECAAINRFEHQFS